MSTSCLKHHLDLYLLTCSLVFITSLIAFVRAFVHAFWKLCNSTLGRGLVVVAATDDFFDVGTEDERLSGISISKP